jgi:hypothetical protein
VALGDLGRRVSSAAATGDAADVLLLVGVPGLRLGHRPLGHPLAASDQVDEHRQEGHHNQEDDPSGLAEAAELVVAEHVIDDPEQDHEVEEDEVDDQQAPEEIAEIHAVLL